MKKGYYTGADGTAWGLIRPSRDKKTRITGLFIVGAAERGHCIELPYKGNEVEITNNTFCAGTPTAPSKNERLLMRLHIIPKYDWRVENLEAKEEAK